MHAFVFVLLYGMVTFLSGMACGAAAHSLARARRRRKPAPREEHDVTGGQFELAEPPAGPVEFGFTARRRP